MQQPEDVEYAQLHHALHVTLSTAWGVHGNVNVKCHYSCAPSSALLLTGMQIMLAVLARGYEWEIDEKEPVKTFPLPTPAWGLPMTFKKLQRPLMAAEE